MSWRGAGKGRALLAFAALGLAAGTLSASPLRADDESEAEKVAREEGETAKPAPRPFTPEELEEELQAASREFPARLRALGQWCSGAGLLATRARLGEAILVLEPADPTARGWLGYKLTKGKWVRGPWKPGADQLEALAELPARRKALADDAGARLRPLLARCEGWQAAGVRDRVLRVLLAVLPDDADLRGANRETQVKGGRWVLAETAASQAGRDRVAAAVKAARAAAAEARQTVVLGRSRGEWKVSVTTQAIEILSQLTQPETDDAVRAALVSHALMGELFGRPATLRRGFRVYLLPDLQSSAGFLAKISELSDAEREHFERYGSYWLDGELVVALSAHAERLDCVSRQVMPGVTTPIGRLLDTPPWIREGLGMYLTYQLLGTRETVFVQSGSYDDEALAREVAQVNSDWVQIARKLVERGYDPNLAVLTGLPMNAMTKDDGLMAYALASYFVEGRPSDLAALLTGLSQAEKGAFHRVLAETCGVDVTALQARFVRWLHELPKK